MGQKGVVHCELLHVGQTPQKFMSRFVGPIKRSVGIDENINILKWGETLVTQLA